MLVLVMGFRSFADIFEPYIGMSHASGERHSTTAIRRVLRGVQRV